MSQRLRILHEDEHFVAIDKPAGFSVHAPENSEIKISKKTNCLFILRDQTGKYLYPVHRLDRATSGIVLYAFTKEAASKLAGQFAEKSVKKKYLAVARGWTADHGMNETPLRSDSSSELLQSKTEFETLAKLELPFKAHPKFDTSRYSLVIASPHTGRMHQIRRHFSADSHPLIGDTRYGDSIHNRYYKNELKIPGLLLRAIELEFTHPATGEKMKLQARKWGNTWQRVFDQFGICYKF